MSDDRVPPHNLQAEESLLGAVLLSKDAIQKAVDIVGPNDFYQPSNGAIFDVIQRMWAQGDAIDPVTVSDTLRREKTLDWAGGLSRLISLQATTPATSSADRYARIIVDHALLRRLIHLGNSIIESAYLFTPAEEIIDTLKGDLAAIDMPSVGLPDGLMTVDDFMQLDVEALAPWVIRGLLRIGWRMMIVAEEGAGKSLLSQMLCLTSARGVHPFGLEQIAPITTLFIDLENPGERIHAGFRMIEEGMVVKDYPLGQAWLWHRPAGLNLRTRADRAAFEVVVATVRPQLVAVCPLYKAYEHTQGESDEFAARQVMSIFDDLRTRYSFALLLEHHAPKEQNGVRRLNPYGTVLWQRWCDLGRSLVRANNAEDLDVATQFDLRAGYRGDRVENIWPKGLFKSKHGLPWAPSDPSTRSAYTWQPPSYLADDREPF